jgi:hypothetical protein
MLPFLSIPLFFVPKRFNPLLIILAFISITQMSIVAASHIVVPADEFMTRISRLHYFQYSTIYTDCLKELLQGKFSWNIGQAWLGLHGWPSLLPWIVGTALILFLFAREQSKSGKDTVLIK